ncbi:MAG TPA: DUF3119 family protein [Coleofasciculaceae cyanobacterium]
MNFATSPATSTQIVELSPSYTLSLVLIVAALPLCFVQFWVGLPIALLGLFLFFQTVTIRLKFTETALDIYRSDTLLRRFPYQDWQNWRIFWTPIPILFYFKEVKSIHFLPILFDPKMLKTCLEQRCPRI